jgi:hypothetical protein
MQKVGAMSAGALKAIEVTGLVVFLGGLVFWFATPGDVIVPPIIVMLIGGAVAGVGWLVDRNQSAARARRVVAQVHAERQAVHAAEAQGQAPYPQAPAPAWAPAQPSAPGPAPEQASAPALPPGRFPPAAATAPEAPRLDPLATAQQLFELASSRPDLRAQIRVHPNAYPGLVEWIDRVGSQR